MRLTSPVFQDGEAIPADHTCQGANTSPRLIPEDVPGEAASLALIVDDPDAPRAEPWVHWLLWNIPATAEQLDQGYPPSGNGMAFAKAKQGTTDFDRTQYDGPCPPKGHGEHRYRFTLYALDTQLKLGNGAYRKELEEAMEGHILGQAQLTGTFER